MPLLHPGALPSLSSSSTTIRWREHGLFCRTTGSESGLILRQEG